MGIFYYSIITNKLDKYYKYNVSYFMYHVLYIIFDIVKKLIYFIYDN
jgi:hypothetical protein